MRFSAVLFVAFLLTPAGTHADNDTPREIVSCGMNERLGFWIWRHLAGDRQLDERKAAAFGITKVQLRTGDGRTLVGAQLHASDEPKGAILVIQGNAWTAAMLVPYLDGFRSDGFDVFVYDFRGYAMSVPGTPRLHAILEDYREILADLRARQSYKKLIVYGFSFGGIIALDALSRESGWDLLVVDSAPSRVSDMGCPTALDPINNLPLNSNKLVIISGGKDRTVSRARAKDLIDAARQRGATAWLEPEWDHPWQTYPDSPNEERYKKLKTLFSSSR